MEHVGAVVGVAVGDDQGVEAMVGHRLLEGRRRARAGVEHHPRRLPPPPGSPSRDGRGWGRSRWSRGRAASRAASVGAAARRPPGTEPAELTPSTARWLASARAHSRGGTMKRSRIWLLLALLLAIALVTSGCFQIRMFKLNKDSIAAGERSPSGWRPSRVSMSTTDTQVGYYFLLIGYDNIDWQGSSQIDADGNWGGPYNKGNNIALTNLLLTDGDVQRQRRRRPGHGGQLRRLAGRGQRHRVRRRRAHRRPVGPAQPHAAVLQRPRRRRRRRPRRRGRLLRRLGRRRFAAAAGVPDRRRDRLHRHDLASRCPTPTEPTGVSPT